MDNRIEIALIIRIITVRRSHRAKRDMGVAEILYESVLLAKQASNVRWFDYQIDVHEIAQKFYDYDYAYDSNEAAHVGLVATKALKNLLSSPLVMLKNDAVQYAGKSENQASSGFQTSSDEQSFLNTNHGSNLYNILRKLQSSLGQTRFLSPQFMPLFKAPKNINNILSPDMFGFSLDDGPTSLL